MDKKSTPNFTVILLIIVSFFAGYLYFKVQSLEQKNNNINIAGTQPQPTNTETNAPLSVSNLKAYAQELKLDTNKFNNCLDKSEKQQAVQKEQSAGSSLGVQGTPGFFVNGRFLGGAFPFENFKEIIDREIAGTGSENYKDYSDTLQKAYDVPPNQPKAFDPVPKKVNVGDAPAEGAKNAKVIIVEYSDFQCPYCVRAYPTVKKIRETYPNDVAIYYQQFPLTNIHQFAQKAAEASLCAKDQDKFWEYANNLFEVQLQ